MTITTIRPTADAYTQDLVYSTGSAAWSLIDDSPDDDTKYVYVANGTQYSNGDRARMWLTLGNIAALPATKRITAIRIRARVRMNAADSGYQAIINANVRRPADGTGGDGDAFITTSTTASIKTGAWRKAPPKNYNSSEWTVPIVNDIQFYCNWRYSVTSNHVNLRLTEAYVDVDIRDQVTVSGVTVSNWDTSTRPTVDWVFNTNADLDKQAQYQVKIFSAAQYGAVGFNPDTSPYSWYSGTVKSSAMSQDVGVALDNGTAYRAYVRAAAPLANTYWYSSWSFGSFTMGLVAPAIPTLTVVSDSTVPNVRNVLTVSSPLNLLSSDDSSFEQGVGNWVASTNVNSIAVSTSQSAHGGQSLAIVNTAAIADALVTLPTGLNGYRVKPSTVYTFLMSFRANTTTRSVGIRYAWYDRTGTIIGSATNGTTATDSNSAWTQVTVTGVTSPATARYVVIMARIVITTAVSETHYIDKVSIATGSSTTFSLAGATNTAPSNGIGQLIVEKSWSTNTRRNHAPARLWAGGDGVRGQDQKTDGFYTTGTFSTVSYDMAFEALAEGSIRWDVQDTTSKLYMGWPSYVEVNPAPFYALHAIPGTTYTFAVKAIAGASFSSQLNLQAIDQEGNAVGSPTNGGAISILTSWTQFSATITIPAGGVYVRAHLDNTASVTEKQVWVDAIQWVIGSTADSVPDVPGGQPMLWTPVRGYGADDNAVIPSDALGAIVFYDEEVPPGYTVTYRARNLAVATPVSIEISSDFSPYVQTMLTSPGRGIFVVKSPYVQTLNKQVYVTAISESMHEEATPFYPIRPEVNPFGQRPVVISDWLGGQDGTITVTCTTEGEWWFWEQKMRRMDALWLVFSDFGGRYIRLMSRDWNRMGFRAGNALCDVNSSWLRTAVFPFVEVDRPI